MKFNLTVIITTLIFFILSNRVSAQTNVSGTLTTDTEWTVEGSPYILTATLGVSSGVTLTINSGVTVQGNLDLLVKGEISVNGTSEDSVIFDQTRLIFKSTDLSSSTVDFVKFINSSGVQLADETEFNQDNPKNSGTLIVSNSNFSANGYARTKGYDSNAKLVLSNCKFISSTIRGYYPRSEIIEIENGTLVNCVVRSDSYNKGLKINSSDLSNCSFSMGCCDANFEITNSSLTNCQASNGEGSPVNGLYKIDNSLLTNTFIDLNAAQFDISNSRFIADQTGDFLLQIGNGNIENTIFTSTNNLSAVRISGLTGYNFGGSVTFRGSTFDGFQVALQVDNFNSFSVNQCSFLNSGQYAVVNNSSKNIDATQNYWGTNDESIIANQIFDGLDDINSGIVDFSNYLSSPRADVPISTPTNVFKGLQENGIYISWDANLETNLAGYKIFTKNSESDDYSLLSDVGNVTSYSTDQISNSDYVAVKAYTTEADGQTDFLEGNESDFSNSAENYIPGITLSSPSICQGEFLEISLNSNYNFTNNEFILQLSSLDGSFDEAINLDSISDVSEMISSTLPDTLQFGATYLIRILSSELSVFSEPSEIIPYSIPSSTFESEDLVCSGETTTITYTGDGSTDASYTWDFDGATVISGNNQGPYELSWATEGTKSIMLEVSENGCSSTSDNNMEVLKTPTSNFSIQAQLCEGESAFVSYTGDASELATYTWSFDGATILSGEGVGPYELSWDSFGSKTISLSVNENGCSSEPFVQQINYSQHPALSFIAEESTCYDENYEITFTGSNYTELDWSFDGANVVSGTGPGPYVLSWNSSGTKFINLVASNNGCSKDSTIIVEIPERPYAPSICLVTVDETSSKNMLVWDYDLESVSQFGIYRETNVSGEYALIEYVDGGLSNSYIDNQSSPEQLSNRYKISSLDSCGTETELSSYHKTIHLTINQGIGNSWNLIWDGYEGVSFGTYQIYRSLDGNSFELLTEIASNLTSFTDTNVSTSDVAYQIAVVTSNSCAANEGGRISQNSTSKSNIARNDNILGVKNPQFQLDIYPNPTFDYINLNSPAELQSYELMTLTGQIIQIGDLTAKHLIDIKALSNGVYLLKVNSSDGATIRRILKK